MRSFLPISSCYTLIMLMDELYRDYQKRTIVAIDLKSFYASCECVERNLDPFTTPLVVCDETRGKGTIILAVSPYLKSLGVPNRLRLYELDTNIPNIIYAMPRMHLYIKKSFEVYTIFRNYTADKDIHIYSIDEAFLDITDSINLYKTTAYEYVKKIVDEVKSKTKLTVCAGIGDNIFMAKVCMDLEAKKKKNFIAQWSEKDITTKLWPIENLTKVWGIGERMALRLNKLGVKTIKDIAMLNPQILHKEFGVKGDELFLHAYGIDKAIINNKVDSSSKNISVGQTLFYDADKNKTMLNILSMVDELAIRLKKMNKRLLAFTIFLITKDSKELKKELTFFTPTSNSFTMRKKVENYLNLPDDILIRQIFLVAFKLVEGEYQSSLFEEDNEKDILLEKTMMKINNKYHNKAIRLSYLEEGATALRRKEQIGGHKA